MSVSIPFNSRVTPKTIYSLQNHEIFCYGANLAGRHGAGAARTAMKWGAKFGEYCFNGQTYGIPTKDENIEVLPLHRIKEHIADFFNFVDKNSHLDFLVTPIGCGLAGYSAQDIAPFFATGLTYKNIYLPEDFIYEIYKSSDC